METKHTKGEWRLQKDDPQVFIGESYNSGSDAEFCAFVQHSVDKREEAFANAKLIATAPDLLEALQELYDFTNNYFGGSPAGKFARNTAFKAIKKATE